MGSETFPYYDEKALQLCLERDRVLCSPEFKRAPMMSQLLSYLVSHRLVGNEAPLKAYTIAVEALGRAEDFDPQSDSYPRVQVGRLRHMLDLFYAHEGGETRLSIPKGSYEIEIISNLSMDPQPLPQRLASADENHRLPGTYKPYIARLAIAFILSAAAFFGIYKLVGTYSAAAPTTIDYPSLALTKPDFAGDPADASFAARIFSLSSSALYRFEGIKVFQAGSNASLTSDYALTSTVISGPQRQINLSVVSRTSDEIIWSETISDMQDTDALDFALAKSVVAIAGPYGAIAQDQRKLLAGSYAAGYPCLLQLDIYLRYRDEGQLDPVLRCVEKTARAYPNDAYALSMSAFGNYIARQRKKKFDLGQSANAMSQHALRIDAQSASANFAMARAAFFGGDCASGRKWGDKSMALNPYDMRTMGYLGVYLIVCNDTYGGVLATRALAVDPNADLLTASSLAFLKFEEGDAQTAYDISTQYLTAAPRNEPSLQMIAVLSSAALGRHNEANQRWAKVVKRFDMPPNSKAGPVLRRFVTNPEMIKRLERSFAEVGVAS
jgi:Flp pilus assembly protein TadD